MVLPLELKNAPTTIQRLINDILHNLLDKAPLVYLDDLLVNSDTDVKHLEDIKHILQHLCDNKLKAKKKKFDFNAQQVEYLGHTISNRTVAMDPSKVSAVKEWPLATNVKQLFFLGFVISIIDKYKNYFRIIAPLTKLLQKDAVYAQGDLQ